MTKKQFTVLSWTWGIILSFIGLCISVCLIATGHKPQKWGWSRYFEIGNGGCGFSCGPFFFISKDAGDYLKSHECGHGIQNAVLGPMMIILTIGSIFRFWYRRIFGAKTSYYDWWFEGEASKLGKELVEKLNEGN